MILEHDDNVYVEGAKHYWRYHGKDTKQFASQVFTYCWVMGGIALACWGLAHFLVLLPHSNPQPHYYGHFKPANIGPTYNQYMKQPPAAQL